MTGRWIGRSVRRPDAHSKLTGELRYASDHVVPGMLVGRVLRSDVARARIHRIDLERARAVTGVTAVIGPNDVGPSIPRFGPLRPDQPVLADGEVRFHGEALAAVAAVDNAAAREALDAIVVELEDLPAIASLDDALRAGAAEVLHESRFAWGELPDDAAVALEREYDGPAAAQHVSIEPHACIASWDARGLTVWAGTQHPFAVRRVLAEMFGLALARVRIVTLPIGGAFGGKGYPKLEPLVALLSRASGQPVGLRASMRESFQLARGAGARVTMRTTVDDDGRLRSQEVQGDFLVGAYADMAPRVVEKSAYLACGPYRTPAARIVGRAIASNTTPSTAFRGFGAPQFTWALESQMDELAGLVGQDPLEFRLQNLCDRGELLLPGQTPCDGEWRETLTRAADAVGYGKPRPRGRGVGVAIAIKYPTPASTSVATVRLHPDASATVQVGTTELGQGSRIAMAQIAAEALGLAIDDISVPDPDTASTPFDFATAASRSTALAGSAVLAACGDVHRELESLAEEALGIPATADAQEGCVVAADGRRVSFTELLTLAFGPGQGEVVGRGTYRGAFADLPLGGPAPFWEVCASASEIEVDEATGSIRVLRHVVVSDVGRAINPAATEGQDLGAAIMGLGQTLGEELRHDERGRLLNADLEGYRIPAAEDVPTELESILIENGDGPGPFGAKGVGESGIMAISPSVGNALHNATRVRVRRLPLTPERVWRALFEHAHTTPSAASTRALNPDPQRLAETIPRQRRSRSGTPHSAAGGKPAPDRGG
jgi:CO/xanthine dehydrogenase Mo-binding subunit